MIVGTLARLARYPVKSTAGEQLVAAEVDARGLVGDRTWAVYTDDGGIASGKTSKRFRKVDGLLQWRSSLPAPGEPPGLHSPGGVSYAADDPAAAAALTEEFGRPLTPRPESGALHFDDCAVHLVTMSSLRRTEELVGGRVDARRLRANLVLDTAGAAFVEDAWTGSDLAIGDEVVLRLGPGMPRCVMVDARHAGVADGPGILKALGREHDVLLGLMASVVRGGTLRVGDAARLVDR